MRFFVVLFLLFVMLYHVVWATVADLDVVFIEDFGLGGYYWGSV